MGKAKSEQVTHFRIFAGGTFTDVQKDVNDWLCRTKNRIKVISHSVSTENKRAGWSVFVSIIYEDAK